MAGTQKVGARQACTQHDTTCAGIWACSVRRLHTTARNCMHLPSTSLSPSVTTIRVCSTVSETEFFPSLEPAVETMCLWQTFVSSQCVEGMVTEEKRKKTKIIPGTQPKARAGWLVQATQWADFAVLDVQLCLTITTIFSWVDNFAFNYYSRPRF